MTLISADQQFEYAGLLLAAPYYPRNFTTGLEVRSSDLQRAAKTGLVAGADYLGGRTVALTVAIIAWDQASFTAAVAAFEAAFAPGLSGELPLKFQVPGMASGGVGLIYCRPRKLSVPRDDAYFTFATEALVELYATDPLIYSDTLMDVQTGLSTPSGGMVFPLVFPLVFGSTGSFGTITVTNTGTVSTAPKFHIVGPVTNPTIRNETLDKQLTVSIVLAAGDYLDIDVAARSVLLNGSTSRYSSLTTAQWFNLVPGGNEIRFTAAGATAATVDVIYRSAWI